MTELQHRQRKGEKITMCEVIDKFVARGREQGIQLGIEQGIEQGIQKGIQQARTEYAQSCTNLYITQGQSQQSILDMLQTCFQYDKEEARELYKECMN